MGMVAVKLWPGGQEENINANQKLHARVLWVRLKTRRKIWKLDPCLFLLNFGCFTLVMTTSCEVIYQTYTSIAFARVKLR